MEGVRYLRRATDTHRTCPLPLYVTPSRLIRSELARMIIAQVLKLKILILVLIKSPHATVTDTKDAMKVSITSFNNASPVIRYHLVVQTMEEQIQRAEDNFKQLTDEHGSEHAITMEEFVALENRAALQNPGTLEPSINRCQRQEPGAHEGGANGDKQRGADLYGV